jgi:16S rRNA (adenine1518-N6/adenine1519-N6)-dimethyltransferase
MHAKKSLGQNFLVGDHYPKRIVASVAPKPEETILEIGPGHGALTEFLIASGARVIAIELDRDLIPKLREKFSKAKNFQLVEADALKINLAEIIKPATHVRVVANLPYYISTAILQHLITQRKSITDLTLMLQSEVVTRLTATPGGKEYGYLSALVQFYCEAHHLFDVPPGAFRPVPKVTSSMMRLTVRENPVAEVSDEKFFVALISSLFAQRRKNISNNLRASRTRLQLGDDEAISNAIDTAGLDGRRRGETLTLLEMAKLAENLQKTIEA